MAKDKLTEVSEKVGAALGKANKQAHLSATKVSEASKVAKEELREIAKQVESLRRQLEKTTKRLKSALH